MADRARSGSGAALVVRGEPGVGKSALLADLVEHLRTPVEDASEEAGEPVRVLRTQGFESEAPLPFAALHRLLRPVLGHLEGVPDAAGRALRAAFGEIDEDAGDRHLIFLATLNLLSEAAHDQPVLAVVDDVHWLDDASAAALLFTARRLEGEALSMLFGVRAEESERLDLRDLPTLEVTGVREDAAGEILADTVEGPVAPEVRAELLAATSGNPLGLVELTRALSAGQLSGRAPLPHRLPVTKGVEAAFLDTYRRLTPAAQTLLLVAATDDSGRVSTIARAAADLDAGTDALDEAERSGLVAVGESTLTLRHPLVRSAIYGAATGARRRQAHAALADALAGTPDEDRRAWHLAASADEPDDEVVDALDRAAQRARRRGGHEAAAAAWTRAAELTADPAARARRLYAAAESTLMAGRPAETDQLARAGLVDATDPVLRSGLLQLRGQVEWNNRSLDEGYRIVCEAAATVADADPSRARVLAMLAAALATFGAHSPEAPDPAGLVAPPERRRRQRRRGRRACCSRGTPPWPGATGPTRPRPSAAPGTRPSPPRRTRFSRPTSRSPPCTSATTSAPCSCTTSSCGTPARRMRRTWSSTPSPAAPSSGSPPATGTRPRRVAQEALLLDRNLGLEELVAFPLAELAVVAALRGEDRAPALMAELEETVSARPLRGVVAPLVSGLRHWAAARQPGTTPATALHHLEQIELPLVRGMAALDRIETAVHADREDLAREWVEELRDFAEGTDMPWARAVTHHGLALLDGTDPTYAEGQLRLALEWHARSPRRPDRGRTLLALGEHLRRNRRRADARVPLREALDLFETLGARHWAERARQELRASGETARRGAEAASAALTPSEAQVAAQVRQGLSNKEVAARLFVSPRTVDFHLRNVYAKLGITSRTELVSLAADPA